MVVPSAGQLCCGAKAIAAFLGATPRQVYHLTATRRLPHFYQGRMICARRSSLLQWIAEQEAGQPRRADSAQG